MKKQTTAREDRLFQACRSVSTTGELPRDLLKAAAAPKLARTDRASFTMIKPIITDGMSFYVEHAVARTGAVTPELERKIKTVFHFLMKGSTEKQQKNIKGLPKGWVAAGKKRYTVALPPAPGELRGRLCGCR